MLELSLNFAASSSLVSLGKTTFNWKLTLSQKQCSIFNHPFQDPEVRFESPAFNIDLFREGHCYSTMSLSLVMGISDSNGFGQHVCCRCYSGHANFGPTLFIRNQSSSTIEFAEITLQRHVSHQTGEKLNQLKSDYCLTNITLKGNELKKIKSFHDLSRSGYAGIKATYPGDFVIFGLYLNVEVFQLVAN